MERDVTHKADRQDPNGSWPPSLGALRSGNEFVQIATFTGLEQSFPTISGDIVYQSHFFLETYKIVSFR